MSSLHLERTYFAPVTTATFPRRSGMPVAGSHTVENHEPIFSCRVALSLRLPFWDASLLIAVTGIAWQSEPRQVPIKQATKRAKSKCGGMREVHGSFVSYVSNLVATRTNPSQLAEIPSLESNHTLLILQYRPRLCWLAIVGSGFARGWFGIQKSQGLKEQAP